MPVLRQPAFVARSDEMGMLTLGLEDAAAGRGGVVLVTGAAGMGKSALLAELAGRARAAGSTVLAGRAVEGGGAFRPLVEALLPVADPALGDDPALVPYRPVLARLLPGWGAAGSELGLSHVDPVIVLGEALGRLLGVLGSEGVRLLTLDDLHWGDPDTAAVLDYLAGRLAGTPVLVVVAARSDESTSACVELLQRNPTVLRLPLAGLDTNGLTRLAEQRLGAPVSTEILDHLEATSDGVPLVAVELLDVLGEEGTLCLVDGTWQPTAPLRAAVPASFAALVERRLGRLDAHGRAVVDVAAVLAQTIDGALVAAASGREEDDVASGLRQALEAHLLVQDPATGAVRWSHALTREAVMARLMPLERAALARRGGEALAERRDGLGGDRLLLAADLLARGGRGPQAAGLLVEAAREAVTAGALTAAESLLRQAEGLAASHVVTRSGATVELVRVLALAGRTDDAMQVAQREMPRLSGASRTRLARSVARALVTADRFEEAARYLDGECPGDDPHLASLAAQVALGPAPGRSPTSRCRRAVGPARRKRCARVWRWPGGACGRPTPTPVSTPSPRPSRWPAPTAWSRGGSGPCSSWAPWTCSAAPGWTGCSTPVSSPAGPACWAGAPCSTSRSAQPSSPGRVTSPRCPGWSGHETTGGRSAWSR
jgi:hypothetical protein